MTFFVEGKWHYFSPFKLMHFPVPQPKCQKCNVLEQKKSKLAFEFKFLFGTLWDTIFELRQNRNTMQQKLFQNYFIKWNLNFREKFPHPKLTKTFFYKIFLTIFDLSKIQYECYFFQTYRDFEKFLTLKVATNLLCKYYFQN